METSVNNECKAFTSLEQSKKLAEILPLESADMVYLRCYFEDEGEYSILVGSYHEGYTEREDGTIVPVFDEHIPAWSLAALLDYLSANFRTDIRYLDNYWELDCRVQFAYGKELIDACYEMIIKLHELKML